MYYRKLITNFLLFLLVIVVIYGYAHLNLALRFYVSRTYNVVPSLLAGIFIPLLFGMFIRIPALVNRWTENRQFDLARFGVQFVPGFVLLAAPRLSMLLPFEFGIPWYGPVTAQSVFTNFLGIWAGTVLIDCIKGGPLQGISEEM